MSSTARVLFEDDNESLSMEEDDEQTIRVNKRYAKEYQSRKQREELQTMRQEQGSEDSSTSESEDEEGDLLSPSVDVSILKVRQQ